MTIQNYINGKLLPPQAGHYLDNFEPATGQVFGQIPDSDADDVAAAVAAAKAAQPAWAAMPLEQRCEIMLAIAHGIEARLDELALAESTDNGKPLWLAKSVDIPRAASNFRFFATGLLHFAAEAHEQPGVAAHYTMRQPVGLVGAISPWNLPLYLFTWKIAPALAAGNAVIAKPSEVTPLSAYLLSQVCIEAGLPAGVLNIVHGLGHKVGATIVSHPDIKALTFTGSTRVGQEIARVAAPMFKKISLELGGKNPVLIFADCDYEQMLETTLQSSFRNQGQICLCGSRIYVERAIYDRFKKDFTERTRALVVGDPLDDNSNLGAVVSEAHYRKVLSHIALAEEEGGTILAGGKALHLDGRLKDGWFIAPTIIEGLTNDCRTNQEEIFGPVVTIMPFDTEEEALALANGTPYGLASVVWTNHIKRATRLASAIRAGLVWVNCWMVRDLRTPFGGVNDSGIGREGGWEAFRFFTEAKNVTLKY